MTLIELLVAGLMTAVLTGAIGSAYISSLGFERRSLDARQSEEARIRFEDRLSRLIASATLGTDRTDRLSYFIGEVGAQQSGPAAVASTNSSDTLVFTCVGQRLPGIMLDSNNDFESMNSELGPQGGSIEVGLSMTPVGNPPEQKQGLFIRQQRPADGDPTQGGLESVFDAGVRQIGFEFFDGLNWQPQWNTQTGAHRLPAAVRVSYQIEGDEQSRVFVVRIASSNVTPDNPVAQGANQ
ncbi:MAG: hypothetical protein HY248_01880 [Fimbriimonas ginsengisoli]|uniref:Type II secretion system protein J n=1 Tax=Fimbriimonas ginsengisoli TaxID=1005039 RepID=A0A931LV22_FIMGI|nr:hypothetical protein [Fimbriimonas ginsengisoli]MBI3721276.1 hypothetical protein [Fimbriimonas ginsengisoli]